MALTTPRIAKNSTDVLCLSYIHLKGESMINRLSVATIWVTDQNEALRFYTEKLGFEICNDVTTGDYCWLTVGLKSQPDIKFQLAALKPGGAFTQEDVDQLAKLVEAGKMGVGPWKTDDCHKTYETFKSRGVEFIQTPTDRPYGIIEAVFKDNSGNIMVLAQDK
jgi:catechol 2,3-dioxygenase-like lactoylglutathione lyase family enzyme